MEEDNTMANFLRYFVWTAIGSSLVFGVMYIWFAVSRGEVEIPEWWFRR